MAFFRAAVAALLASSAQGVSQQAALKNTMNPIMKVVTLLQDMQHKVIAEGEAEKDLYKKFMCYCTTGTGDLSASITAAETKMPEVTAEITVSEEKLEQSKADLAQAQTDRAAAEEAMKEATGIREKEAAAFAAVKAEADTNTAAIVKAIAAVEKGMAGSFLQTEAAQLIRNLANNDRIDMVESDRQDLAAFLSQGSQYAPQSGQITGILKEMGDTMAAQLAEDIKTEEASIASYEALTTAKTKEVAALTATVEVKTTQIGELGVAIVQLKEDLSDTSATYSEDKKFLQELESSCATKTQEWEERSKTRAEELVALADTIKVLNDDDALDLFKKTLPGQGASFVQLRVTAASQRAQALGMIRSMHKKADKKLRPALDMIALALSGKKALTQGAFDKVIVMCNEMVEILKKEQLDDHSKKEYCELEFDHTEDSKKALERKIADEEASIADAKEGIKTLTEEIAALEAGIIALDKSVAEATEQRKAENVEYKELMASDSAAKEVLGFAKNRLNKFYNPKLYKEAPKQELSEEDRIFVSNGGTPPPTEAPGGIAGTGVTVLAQVQAHNVVAQGEAAAPPPPPETWGAYTVKSEDSNGVIAMIDLLIKDLTKELTEAEAEEKHSQEDYETMMNDSADKRTTDSKALEEKMSAKAAMEADLLARGEAHKGATSELMATEKYIASLHAECDWLIQYFETRKAARADEVESLKRAKSVLSGADYALIQTRARGNLRRR
eukprot:CAMPEP_0203863384 /NCGR_PEP_ID=MMETSP0359-20131031/14129_1 /ASSEMBLY_ACC=CAM_ASM_000338 /TAXON_ID=268821 /ORGANISM="Scrippsiella Hangoei, Strain SHTV-5" /LENGTH=730 /DNA_ID=CAMNT_0050780913 /DNA_START=75 /DNA_END=2267 /DNA_ORIENTATION=-